MDQFELEKQKILKRIKNLDKIKVNELYTYMGIYKKNSLLEAKELIKMKDLNSEIINNVKDEIKRYSGIYFSVDETEGFLKIHPQTALTLIKFGIDTESADRIYSDLFDWFLYEMPSPQNGHKLSEEESLNYFKLIKEVASIYGFRTV